MDDPFKLALAVARFLAMTNVIAGLASVFAALALLVIGAIAVFAPASGHSQLVSSVLATLLVYGVLYLVVGGGMLLCSRWIARMTARIFSDN